MAIYRSNLTAPDLTPYFKLRKPPMLTLGGHDSPSDPDFGPRCGYWTHDEAAILFCVAKSVPRGVWVDIGARFGWTGAHIAAAGQKVVLVDPDQKFQVFQDRVEYNLSHCWGQINAVSHSTAAEFFVNVQTAPFSGFVIDGCHDSPDPLNDAMGAHAHAKPDCIIMLHDFQGWPVRDAVRWLMDNGWRCRVYWTPNQVACCWRGHGKRTEKQHGAYTTWGWLPPDHVPDPAIDWRPIKAEMRDFQDYWSRCE